MAVTINHATTAGGVDSGDGKISKNAWNESHVISGLGTAAESDAGDFAPTSHTHTSADVTDFAEVARDTLGVAITAGRGITKTVDDGADTITLAQTPWQVLVDHASVGTGTAYVADLGASADFTEIAVYFDAVSHNSGTNQTLRVEFGDSAPTYTAVCQCGPSTAATVAWAGFARCINAHQTGRKFVEAAGGNGAAGTVARTQYSLYSASIGAVRYVRLSPSSGNFDAGNVTILGRAA